MTSFWADMDPFCFFFSEKPVYSILTLQFERITSEISWFSPLIFFSFTSGSISSCDAFLNVFQSKGLRQEVICPCASSPEALTVAIRRYGVTPGVCGALKINEKCIQVWICILNFWTPFLVIILFMSKEDKNNLWSISLTSECFVV